MYANKAVTTSGGVTFTLVAVLVIYPLLTAATIATLLVMARRWRRGADASTPGVPYGPTGEPHPTEVRP